MGFRFVERAEDLGDGMGTLVLVVDSCELGVEFVGNRGMERV